MFQIIGPKLVFSKWNIFVSANIYYLYVSLKLRSVTKSDDIKIFLVSGTPFSTHSIAGFIVLPSKLNSHESTVTA
jgi:hypothetical protein